MVTVVFGSVVVAFWVVVTLIVVAVVGGTVVVVPSSPALPFDSGAAMVVVAARSLTAPARSFVLTPSPTSCLSLQPAATKTMAAPHSEGACGAAGVVVLRHG